jgi:hypothetical protein
LRGRKPEALEHGFPVDNRTQTRIIASTGLTKPGKENSHFGRSNIRFRDSFEVFIVFKAEYDDE